MLKVKLILLAFCLLAVYGAHLKLDGIAEGEAKADQEAFDAYTHFASQMKAVHHKTAAHAPKTVWAAYDGEQ